MHGDKEGHLFFEHLRDLVHPYCCIVIKVKSQNLRSGYLVKSCTQSFFMPQSSKRYQKSSSTKRRNSFAQSIDLVSDIWVGSNSQGICSFFQINLQPLPSRFVLHLYNLGAKRPQIQLRSLFKEGRRQQISPRVLSHGTLSSRNQAAE